MKVFERDGKINFVDEKNVFLGYDMQNGCCEDFGWFISDFPQEGVIKDNHDTLSDLTSFSFDTAFFKLIPNPSDSGGIAIFRIFDGVTDKYIHIYNFHNGYYCHGFDFEADGHAIRQDVL